MIKYIDLNKSREFALPFFNEEQAKLYSSLEKGWSFSYVYHFTEIKNVFIALKNIPYQGKDDFTRKAINSGLPFVKTPWDSRRILEQLNALINFELITKYYQIESNYFIEDEYTNNLTKKDIELFSNIYHEYFRFKEIHSWLLNPFQSDHAGFLNQVTATNLSKSSIPIFPFFIENRFNDAFIFSLTDNTDIFRIPTEKYNKNGGLMRFWDVYVKWGQELKLLEKFNLKNLDFELSNNLKSLSCVYYVNQEKPKFKLLDFIKSEYKGKHIHIPNLVFKIAIKNRYRINDIKDLIIQQALEDNSSFSLQRTSEIFIRNTEINFVPKFNDSYISHLLLQ
ncbi:MAG: hypothetical protein J0L62_11130 [Bacteroidetes bacterium]|nr:hypothetical protein [Bacteroidota bacterium]